MKKVIRLTESELTDLIHRIIVETEMESEMDSKMHDGEMDEAWYSFMKREFGDVDAFMDSLKTKIRNYEYLTGNELSREERKMMMDELTAEAKDDDYAGELVFKGPKGERELVYVPAREAKARGKGVTSISR
jgi:hypothetical protein